MNFSAGTLTAAQYQQSDSYNIDSGLTSGPNGGYTYGDSSHAHAVTATSSGYSAAYDAAGNMTCRALTSATTCNGTQTGQQLSYDSEGRLSSWQNQPSSPTSTANYLYDGAGNRVAMPTTVNGTTTLTVYIGSIEEVQTTGSTTITTTYYTVGGHRIAAKINGAFDYFGYDALGSQVVVLNSTSAVIGSQLYGPYGNPRYSFGILPTSIGFTGQQSDSVTGLDYYVARYYDPVVGQFLAADTVQGNSQGIDPYAYVGGNPETRTDPTGHCWPICTALIGAAVGLVAGAVVGVVSEAAQHGTNFGSYNWGHVAVDAGAGAVAGALVGTGVGAMARGATGVVTAGAAVGLSASASTTIAGITTAAAIGAGTGLATSTIAAVADRGHQSFAQGLQSVFEGTSIGAIGSALTAGIGDWAGLGGNALLQGSQGIGRAALQGLIQGAGGFAGNVVDQVWDNWDNGRSQTINWGNAWLAGGISFGAGAIGQWAYDHWPVFQTGTSYRGYSRAARAAARAENWFAQNTWGNALSGAIQGGVQLIQSSAPSEPASAYDGPRIGRPFSRRYKEVCACLFIPHKLTYEGRSFQGSKELLYCLENLLLVTFHLVPYVSESLEESMEKHQ